MKDLPLFLSTPPFLRRVRRIRRSFFALWFLIVSEALALDPSRAIAQYNCRTWTRQNGLPANHIKAIVQSADDYLWLGTTAGLVRFDGFDFKLIEVSSATRARSKMVNSLAAGSGGGVWVGLELGAYCYWDGKSLLPQWRPEWGGTDISILSLCESRDGSVWLAYNGSVDRVSRSGVHEPILPSTSKYRMNAGFAYEDPEGRMWFGTANNGVIYWKDGKTTSLSDPLLETVVTYAIAEDREENLWVGTTRGLYRYDRQLQRQETFLPNTEIGALLVDKAGALWIGTTDHGLFRYWKGALTSFQNTEGLAGQTVLALCEDREGGLWVGTPDGLTHLTDVKFPLQFETGARALPEIIAVAASRRGGAWIGHRKGLVYFDGQFHPISLDPLAEFSVKRIFEASNGDVYIVHRSKTVGILSDDKLVATHEGSAMVVGIVEDSQGVIVSDGGNLFRVGKERMTPYLFDGPKPNLAWVFNLAMAHDEAVWVAAVSGIYRIKDGKFTFWPNEHGPDEGNAMFIMEDNEGVIWIGLLNGIARIKDGRRSFINLANGLFDDNIYAIVADDSGYLWVDSSRGIFRVSQRAMNAVADGKADHVDCEVYEGEESIKPMSKTRQERVAAKTPDGHIWFASSKGVLTIDPTHIPTNQIPPPVLITRVRVNGQEVDPRDLTQVPPGRGELEIQFTGISYIAPERIQFRYQLEGYDKAWVNPEGRRNAFYTNLKPGRYTFHVIAANADGVWNKTGDALTLSLRPHFYQTVWFDLLCAAGVIASLAGLYTWRMKQLNAKQRSLQEARDALEKEVSSRTAELRTANGSLQTEIEGHRRTEAELKQRTQALEMEIEERRRMQLEVDRVHRELLEVSRQAGMAEVATSVLHNVGNVLNSVNIGAIWMADSVKGSKAPALLKVAKMLNDHRADLGEFITTDPKGRQIPDYLHQLAEQLAREQTAQMAEVMQLKRNIDQIKEIVAKQQDYTYISGVKETVAVAEVVEESLRKAEYFFGDQRVEIIREFDPVPTLTIDRHKLIQILAHLLRNAHQACRESGRADPRIIIQINRSTLGVRISVNDNGLGIHPEQLPRVFHQGFTANRERQSHGIGLHSSILAAKELGMSLTAASDGLGHGATFVCEIPLAPVENESVRI